MGVIIGSARSNENGGIAGGKAGDQKNGKEVSTQGWYKHSKGWYVIRANGESVREKIADCMEKICANDNIGYCQTHRETLTSAAKPYGYDPSKVTKAVETDCSAAVRLCVLYAGISVSSFSTATEKSALLGTGKFEVLSDSKTCNSSDYLLRGDILVTRTKGHTVVVLNNGAKIVEEKKEEKKSGWVNEDGGFKYYLGDTGEPVTNDWHKDSDSGKWYWFDGNGFMVKNAWKSASDKWYYLGSDGAMVTDCVMAIGTEIFAFDENGVMLTGTLTLHTNDRGALVI